METTFGLSNLLVMPFWLAMILAPGWRGTERLLRTPLGVLAPALLYLGMVVPRLSAILPVVARPDLATVTALLGTAAGTTIAWAHFLAFDLFVARWIYLDARGRGVSGWVTSPLLLLTQLLGPIGLLGYLAVRASTGTRLWARLRDWRAHVPADARSLVGLVIGSLALLAVSLALPLVDARTVLGASVWVKPAKFAVSAAITAATLALILPALQPLTRGMRRSISLIVWPLALELSAITMQSIRGVPSHFNNATLFDGAVFTVMGVAILIVWGAFAHLAYRSFRQRFASPALGWGIRMGFVAFLLGSGLGGTMPPPNAAQRASLAAGEHPAMVGSHAVGVPDGGPGLPIVGWSTTGGDLRIPHFIGMHGWQVLPLLGWWLARRRTRTSGVAPGAQQPTSWQLVLVAGSSYVGLVAITLIQALRGQPLLRPDAWTWGSIGTWLLATALAAGAVLLAASRRAPHSREHKLPTRAALAASTSASV